MTLQELKTEIRKYQYFEDDKFIDASLACVIASRLGLGNPLWLILIGPSSSGKTQILRPINMTDKKFIHSLDDITENTFLSGAKVGKEGSGESVSLLQRIGRKGLIVISDMTGILSKNADSRASILAQLRMIYDGSMTKYVGTSSKALIWEGSIGILGGGTPAIYAKMEEVGSLGERFIYYRLHDYSGRKASEMAFNRTNEEERKLNEELSVLYGNYIKEVCLEEVSEDKNKMLSKEQLDRLIDTCTLAENMRAKGEYDWKSELLIEIPVPAMPIRTALQLKSMCYALILMKKHDREGEMIATEKEMEILEWCAYSLVNDQKRACMRVVAAIPFGTYISTARIGDVCGLPTNTVRMVMQLMSAVKIISRSGSEGGLAWSITKREDWTTIRRIEGIKEDLIVKDRIASLEEKVEIEKATNQAFDEWGK